MVSAEERALTIALACILKDEEPHLRQEGRGWLTFLKLQGTLLLKMFEKVFVRLEKFANL